MTTDVVKLTHVTAAVIANMLDDTRHFNSFIIGLPIPPEPQPLQGPRKDWAIAALTEELEEFMASSTVIDQADALVDLVYFALGRIVEMGVPVQDVWDEVQRANMDKQRGKLSKRPGSQGFDAIKPAGWRGPDHEFLMTFKGQQEQINHHYAFLYHSFTRRVYSDMGLDRPKIAIIGHARHGKDTVAELLRDDYGFQFQSSSQWAAEHIMMAAFKEQQGIEYPSVQACFEDRVYFRAFWYETIKAYCKPDGAKLGRNILRENDIYVGIRNEEELRAIQYDNLVDLVIWVDAGERMPPEDASSCTVHAGMADLKIDNNGTAQDLQRNVQHVMSCLLPRVRPDLFITER